MQLYLTRRISVKARLHTSVELFAHACSILCIAGNTYYVVCRVIKYYFFSTEYLQLKV